MPSYLNYYTKELACLCVQGGGGEEESFLSLPLPLQCIPDITIAVTGGEEFTANAVYFQTSRT